LVYIGTSTSPAPLPLFLTSYRTDPTVGLGIGFIFVAFVFCIMGVMFTIFQKEEVKKKELEDKTKNNRITELKVNKRNKD
jgi:hypothetical protein